MEVLNLHEIECLEIAKRILGWNFINPLLVKTNSHSHMDTLIMIDGKKLAEKLELKIKSSLEKSDLSNKYFLEFDFDNPNLQNSSLFFEKIIESADFYQVPESVSEDDSKDLQWFKKITEGDKGLRKEFGIVEVNPKLNLESLDLVIASPIEVETVFEVEAVFGKMPTKVEVGRIQQYTLPHERGFEPPIEISKRYLTRRFEQKQPVQILSTKTTTITKTLSNGYTPNNFIVKIFFERILKEIESTIEYQTIAEFTEEQYSFVNWAKEIVETVDKYIRRFDKLYYTEEELKELAHISTERIEVVYLIEFNGIFKCLVKAKRLKKILADGSLLGQKEEIELKETKFGLEVKDTDIERIELSYSEWTINPVPLYH
ncbi:TPA: hypothetical protein U9N24_000641 [Streptococcus agalactiae]|nr:hypothetical protein [Streptococcus agalactiae]